MLASLALFSLLQAPVVGADGLALAQPRFTLGPLGPTRSNSTVKPGDSLVLAFDIQGITADNAGKASYTTAVDVTDASGKSIFKQSAKKFQEFLPLGGAVMPAIAKIDLGLDIPAGKYVMNVAVTDGAGGKSAGVKQEFTVAPKGFDLVRVHISGDGEGLTPIAAYGVGQPFWVHGAVVGFTRGNDAAKQPKVTVQLRVLDQDLKPIVPQPFSGTFEKDILASATSLPFLFHVPLNRPGSYFVQLTAKDELGRDAAASLAFPITVLPTK